MELLNLVAGEEIQILVGQLPGGGTYNGAGGGGSFVTRAPHNTNESILLIAGGGGGSVQAGINSNANALIETSGGSSQTGALGGSDGYGAPIAGYSGPKLCRSGSRILY